MADRKSTGSGNGKRRVALLYGGRSGEHDVSLQSAASIVRNIDLDRNSVILIGLAKDGRWFLQPETLFAKVREQGAELTVDTDAPLVYGVPQDGLHVTGSGMLAIDVVFPVLHGTFGEDGTVQGYMDVCGLPYVGAGVAGSSVGFDKSLAKNLWNAAGLPIVPFIEIRDTPQHQPHTRIQDILSTIESDIGGLPVFVKPARCGSSVGVSRADTVEDLERALKEAARFDWKIVIEPAIRGREIECSVTGNEHARSWALGEVVPRSGFYDYRSKYIDPDGAQLVAPAALPEAVAQRIRDIARRAFETSDCEGLARIDFFYIEEEDRILLNEINTIPGFTRISMFPVLCREYGLPYSELIDRVIDLAEERRRRIDALEYELPVIK